MAIDVGDVYRCSWTNTSPGPNGGLVNADSVTLTIVQPDDSLVVQGPVAPSSTGKYQFDFTTTQPGRHVAQWRGTGANPGAYVEIFDVRTLTPQYLISLAAMKDQLNITTTAEEETLRTYIESATDTVERISGEVAMKRSFTEEHRFPALYRGLGVVNASMNTTVFPRRGLALRHFPVVSLTSLARVDGTMTWDTSLLHVESATGVVDVLYGADFSGHIVVTYTAGYQVIPAKFGLAAGFIVEHLWQTRRPGRSGAANFKADTTMVPGIGYAVPNQAIEVLGGGIPGFA